MESKKKFVFDKWCEEIDTHPAFINNCLNPENYDGSAALDALKVSFASTLDMAVDTCK